MQALALESVRYGVDIKMWGRGTDVIVCVITSNLPNFIHMLTYLEPFLLWFVLQQSAQKHINVAKYYQKSHKLDWGHVTELTNDLCIDYYTNCKTLNGQKKILLGAYSIKHQIPKGISIIPYVFRQHSTRDNGLPTYWRITHMWNTQQYAWMNSLFQQLAYQSRHILKDITDVQTRVTLFKLVFKSYVTQPFNRSNGLNMLRFTTQCQETHAYWNWWNSFSFCR